MLSQMASLLVEVVAGFFAYTLLARFHFQWLRVPLRNPIGEFILAVTNWMVVPARRVIPSLAGFDLASLLLAFAIRGAAIWALAAIAGVQPEPGRLSGLAAVTLLRYSLHILVLAIIVQAVLSWVNPYNEMAGIFNALTRPFLAPIRRFVPVMGGLDLSPLVLLVILQLLFIPLEHLQAAARGIAF
ncbi:MAG: YggT family protein [Betaproteobacteria bacterium]|nr:YggT family protein [Betaproteobacteria bacterium]